MHRQAILKTQPFQPAEYPIPLIYTAAEHEKTTEIRTNITSYVNQSMAEFSVGQLDIDRDWDTYVRRLRTLGSEELLAVDRAAYARMTK